MQTLESCQSVTVYIDLHIIMGILIYDPITDVSRKLQQL